MNVVVTLSLLWVTLATPAQALETNSTLFLVTTNVGDTTFSLDHRTLDFSDTFMTIPDRRPAQSFHRVVGLDFGRDNRSLRGVFLERSSNRITWKIGDVVDGLAKDGKVGNSTIQLLWAVDLNQYDFYVYGYHWYPGAPPTGFDYTTKIVPSPQAFDREMDITLAFRWKSDEGKHYGWVRLTRPDTEPLTLFAVQAWAIHPFPDEPIEAGLPPRPWMHYQVTENGIEISWNPAWNSLGFELETTASITSPVVWEKAVNIDSNPAQITTQDQQRYYRLVGK